MTGMQRLRKVELPLAVSVILAGLRTATVTCVGVATIAAAIGAGGLGELIFRGVASVDNGLVLAGAVPAAVLALCADGLLGLAEKRLAGAAVSWLHTSHSSQKRDEWGTPAFVQGRERSRSSASRRMTTRKATARTTAKARSRSFTAFRMTFPKKVAAVWCCVCLLWLTACAPPRSSHVVVGAKNFTEQVVLGELLAQEIEAAGAGKVERRFYLAGSYLCQQAMVSGRIDAYVEYTGTALSAILKQPVDRDASRVRETISKLYEQKYGIRVGPELGFEDTFAMVVRGDDARRLGLKTISDMARLSDSVSEEPDMVTPGTRPTSRPDPISRLGVGYEFAERPGWIAGVEYGPMGCGLRGRRGRWSWGCCIARWRRGRWILWRGTRPMGRFGRWTLWHWRMIATTFRRMTQCRWCVRSR